jgi:hypothetical protein
VRDAAAIEDAGVPSIALIHDVFEHAADLQAKTLGRPKLTRIVLPQGRPEASDEQVDALAREAFRKIMAVLAAV